MYKKQNHSIPIRDKVHRTHEPVLWLGGGGWVNKYNKIFFDTCRMSSSIARDVPHRRPTTSPREGCPRFFPPTFTNRCALDGGGRALSGNIDHKSAEHRDALIAEWYDRGGRQRRTRKIRDRRHLASNN